MRTAAERRQLFRRGEYKLGQFYQVDATTGVTSQLLPFGVATTPTPLTYDPTAS